MKVPLQMQPSQAYPDGLATWFVKGQARDELVRAMAEAGAPAGPPEAGAIIDITFVAERAVPGMNPAKQSHGRLHAPRRDHLVTGPRAAPAASSGTRAGPATAAAAAATGGLRAAAASCPGAGGPAAASVGSHATLERAPDGHGVHPARRRTVNTTIHAELTNAGDRIVLLATGPIDEIAYAAKQLQQLTPLIKTSEPKGALVLPATWPAVVQLAAVYASGWRPGPRLQAWTREQTVRRLAPVDTPLSVPVPAGLTPRPYQVAGAQLIAATGHALISDEPGTGKTITAILGLGEPLFRLRGRGNEHGPPPRQRRIGLTRIGV